MLRVVIDTNVLVSSLISRHLGRQSASYLVYQALLQHRLAFISSAAALYELEEVLNREAIVRLHHVTTEQVGEIVDNLATTSDLVVGNTSMQAVLADPKDDKFIAAALEGRADYIVSVGLPRFRGHRDKIEVFLWREESLPKSLKHKRLTLQRHLALLRHFAFRRGQSPLAEPVDGSLAMRKISGTIATLPVVHDG